MLIPAASDNQTRQSCLPSVVAVFILIDARFHPDCRATLEAQSPPSFRLPVKIGGASLERTFQG
jgi:hypothetical protein